MLVPDLATTAVYLNRLSFPARRLSLERSDLGKMNIQLMAHEENQDRAQRGKNEAGGMKSFVCRARKHVCNAATDDRSDDAEHDRPENRYVHMHHRFSDNSRDKTDENIPD